MGELNELQTLDGGAGMGDDIEPDYVEPDLSDMRRSRFINSEMVTKLNQ